MFNVIMICVVCISILLMIIVIYHNKFNFAIIKIEEAENNIAVLLDKKIELLDRTRPIIKKELKMKEFLEDIELVKDSKINHFEMNSSLKDIHNELVKVLDDNEKLFKSDALVSIIEEINSNEEGIVGSIKFYNDNVVIFNHLIASFPSNLVGFLWHYKKKEFYSNEKKEMYEILKEK